MHANVSYTTFLWRYYDFTQHDLPIIMSKLYSRKLLRCWSKKWQDTASAIKPVSHLATNGYLQDNIGTKKNSVGMTNILTPRIPQRDPVGVFSGLENQKPCVRRLRNHPKKQTNRRASAQKKDRDGLKAKLSQAEKNYPYLTKSRLPKSLRNE